MTTAESEILQDQFKLDLSQFSMPGKSDPALDRAVPTLHTALRGQKILLVVTAGIAAYKTPGLVRMLRGYGATVDVRMTERTPDFIGQQSLEWAAEGGRVMAGAQLTGDIEHLAPYTLYLVAPATYDFINGMATGRADTPALTTMAAALGRVAGGSAKMLVLPCMNGDMHNPILRENLRKLADAGVEFIPPRTKNGKLEYPGTEFVTVATARHVSESPLKGAPILLTGGPTPVKLDDVRQITNIFHGRLGIEIAKELTIRGANPRFLLGGSLSVPDYLKPVTHYHKVFDEYRDLTLETAARHPEFKFAVLSAAVADYRPKEVFAGKIRSKSKELTLPPFEPTEKVVEMLHAQAPNLPIISFKLLSRVSEEELIEEARNRVGEGGHSVLVVANLFEECSSDMQVVRLVTKDEARRVAGSKREVAQAIVDWMEDACRE